MLYLGAFFLGVVTGVAALALYQASEPDRERDKYTKSLFERENILHDD